MSSQDKSNPSIDYRPDEFYLQDDSPSYFTPSRKPWDTNTHKAQQSQIKPLATDANLSTQYPQHGGPSIIPQSQSQYSNSFQPVQHRIRTKRSTSSQFNSPANSNYNHNNIISNSSSDVMSSNSSNNYPTISSNVEAASAVMAQEMNAIKALKRLSIGALPTLDPDLPNYSSELYRHSSDPTSSLSPNLTVMRQNRPNSTSFDGFDFSSQSNSYSESLVPSASSDSENISFDSTEIDASHASQLLWVPATVHPELAPQEWKTFVQNKIAEIKEAYSDSVKVDDQSNSTGQSSHINRRNSRLSRQIRDQESYTDGADILEKRKSRDTLSEQLTDPTIKSLSNQIKSLGDLEHLANDPLQLARSLSMNTDLYSYYSKPSSLGHKSESQSSSNQISNDNDSPILPAPTSSLRRSTNTRYNKSSIRRGRKDTTESPSLKKIQPEKSTAKATPESSTAISENTNTLPWVTVSAGLPRKIQIPIIGKTLDECPYIGEDPLAYNPQTRILLENDSENIPDIKLSNTKPDIYSDNLQPVEIAPSKQPTEKTDESSHSDNTQRENVVNNSQPYEPKTLPMEASEPLQKESDVTPNYPTTPTEPLIKNVQDLDMQVQNSNNYDGQAGDEDTYGKGKNRKGTWGWLFSGSNPNQSPNSDTTVQSINKEENDSGPIQSQDKPIRSSTTQNQPSKPSASPPISKDRITNFFSKKKSSASLRDQKVAEKQVENTPVSDSKPAEVDVKDNSKYLSVENALNKESRSPSPNGRSSRSKSPNLESQSDGKSKDQGKQRGRYRSRAKSPDKRKPDDQTAKNDSDNTSISSGQNITAKPMSEGSIVAYSPEAAAYYGAPYQIPPHQMSDKSLIMMHHRYPLHIERAIYRLSHIKLANAKRPLAQQVLLSNFMYAYLNLINQGFIQQQQQAQMQLQMQLEQQQKQQQLYQNQYSYEVQQNATHIIQGDNSNNDTRNLRYEQYNNFNNPQH